MDQDTGSAALIAHWAALRQKRIVAAVANSVGVADVAAVSLGETANVRRFELNAQSGSYQVVGADANLAAAQPPELLVGVELVLRGERTDEGVIIEAVGPVWVRFIDELIADPAAFWKLDPRQTEELVAGAYRKYGWHVTLTPQSGDKGRDVIAYREDIGAIRILDQVKRYKPGHVVDAEAVRAMWGVLDWDRKASKAYITTTSTFAPGVYTEFADVMPTRIEFRDGTRLREWLAPLATSFRRA